MTAIEQLGQYYRQQSPEAKRPRPQPLALTPEQQAALDALPATARMTAYRALQAKAAEAAAAAQEEPLPAAEPPGP